MCNCAATLEEVWSLVVNCICHSRATDISGFEPGEVETASIVYIDPLELVPPTAIPMILCQKGHL